MTFIRNTGEYDSIDPLPKQHIHGKCLSTIIVVGIENEEIQPSFEGALLNIFDHEVERWMGNFGNQ
jgi:hypothetical protein